jgi:hypothetical protein
MTLVIFCLITERTMFTLPDSPRESKYNQAENMSSKTSNWIIVVGTVILFLSLCILPAALHSDSDASLLASAGAVFSLGILTIAGGTYLKARAHPPQPSAEPAAAKKKVRGGCELCASQDPVIQCRVHQLQLCPTCLANHYDFRSCVYVPTTRRPAMKNGKTMAKARGV